MPYFRLSHLKNGRWGDDMLATNRKEASEWLAAKALERGVSDIKFEQCDKHGDPIQ